MKYLIGIDAGTTRVKAVLFDRSGFESKVVYRDNEPISTANAGMEQDMNLLWTKVKECLVELLENVDSEQIIGISVTGQGEGCWLIDEKGEPVSNAYLWNDGRATKEIDWLIEEELYDYVYDVTATELFPGTALAHLLWAKNNRPEDLEKADTIFFCKDWIRYKLTGEVAMEVTDAATSLLDIDTLEYPEEMFEKLGLSEYRRLYADKIYKPEDLTTTLRPELAEELGLKKDTPVGAGAIDVVASAIGVGAINSGDTSVILGTTTATTMVTEEVKIQKGAGRFEVHGRDGLYVNLQPTMAGTPNIDWVLENISETKSFDEIDEILSKIPAVPTGVIYHPYITLSGERSPFYNPNARASFFGVNTKTTKYDLVKAVYEGIAFSIKDCLESSTTDEDGIIFLAGGGAESPVWAQIISDVTGRVVKIAEGSEFAAKGAVIMLGVTLGVYDSYEDAIEKTFRSRATYNPNEENTKIYEEFYKLYKKSRIEFTELWNMRRGILNSLEGND